MKENPRKILSPEVIDLFTELTVKVIGESVRSRLLRALLAALITAAAQYLA